MVLSIPRGAWLWPLAALLVQLIAAAPAPAEACTTATSALARVELVRQDAAVVWNPDARRQHLILQPSFEGDARRFALLIPTPSPPTVEEAPERLFPQLEAIVAPEVIEGEETITGLKPMFFCLQIAMPAPSDLQAGLDPTVKVVRRQRVGELEATVISASDPGDVNLWLNQNHFASSEDVVQWLAPYLEAGWTVTALKFADPALETGGQRLTVSPFRLTFDTERPIYPFRAANEGARELTIYTIAPDRMTARLGQEPWGADVVWARPMPTARSVLGGVVPHEDLLFRGWMTVFRGGWKGQPPVADLTFAPARDRAEVVPEAIHQPKELFIPLPLECMLLVAFAGIAIWSWRKRKQ